MTVGTISADKIVYRNGRATIAVATNNSDAGTRGERSSRGGRGGRGGKGGRNKQRDVVRNRQFEINFDKCRAEQLEPLMDLVVAGEPVAFDCEGCILGVNVGKASRGVSRLSIVTLRGEVIYDTFVFYPWHMKQRPDPQWLNLGVKYDDIKRVNGAQAHADVLEVCKAVFDKAGSVVGHAVENDIRMLTGIDFDAYKVYDTQGFAEYQIHAAGGQGKPGLKALASAVLGRSIQDNGHSSVEDARATMELFARRQDQFQPVTLTKEIEGLLDGLAGDAPQARNEADVAAGMAGLQIGEEQEVDAWDVASTVEPSTTW